MEQRIKGRGQRTNAYTCGAQIKTQHPASLSVPCVQILDTINSLILFTYTFIISFMSE